MLRTRCENCAADCPFADNPPAPCGNYRQRKNLTNLDILTSMNPYDLAEFIFLVNVNMIKGARQIGEHNISSCTVSDWEEWLNAPAKYEDGTPPRFWKGV